MPKFTFDLENRECTQEEVTLIKILACTYVEKNRGKIADDQEFFNLAIELIHNGFLAATLIAEQSDDWRKALNEYLCNFEKGYQKFKKDNTEVDIPVNTGFKA